jgi:hypothetical protein
LQFVYVWGRNGRDIPPDRPENAPNADVFGHNRNRRLAMKILAVISILALLTITGAAFTDQLLTGNRGNAQQGN